MTATSLSVFENTVQQTESWLNEIGTALDADAQQQYHALRSVLFAVRDRLTIDEAFDFSAQLPMLVRGIFWESYRPVSKPERFRSREEFLKKVAETMEPAEPVDPEKASRAVFAVLARHIPRGPMDHVRHMMPEDVREMFPRL